jgi:NAD(P)H-quinone oxidoreductase subunit 5
MTEHPYHRIIEVFGTLVIIAPVALLVLLGASSLLGRPLSERVIGRSVQAAVIVGLLSAFTVLGLMLAGGPPYRVPIEVGDWVVIPHYHFKVEFIFDRLSVPFVILSFLLCGTVGAFGTRYLHREPGFSRFFFLYALFLLGVVVATLANTIETLFFGWELVGLSSALLVAYYHERLSPVRNGLRVWCVYRISDAALLVASVFLHHLTGEGEFDILLGSDPWPLGQAHLSSHQALIVGLLILVAAMGKSALVPFSGWLPRAMEGPTPSSAVFYGALSVHLGAFLLLRVSPILDLSVWLRVAVVMAGLVTALFAAFAGRVQTDIKCALSFASLTQVGIIVAEIGLGFRYVALLHILGHGCLRTLQFVRAPTLLHDYKTMENALGTRLPQAQVPHSWAALMPENAREWFYRLALERGYLDGWLVDYVVAPFLGVFRWCDMAERKWIELLGGTTPEQAAARSPDRAAVLLEEVSL